MKEKKVNKVVIPILLMTSVLFAGCTINHPIAEDYNQYLSNNNNQSTLQKTNLETEYFLDSKTVNHHYEFRAVVVGYAHLWIVEFGKMLEENLEANYVQEAFGKLEKQNSDAANSSENLVTFTLEDYQYNNFQAHVSLNITLQNKGNEVINKTYQADGKSQGSKMFWGGPFAMKNATQQSTKLAIDAILNEFINDINQKNVAQK